MSNLNLEFSGNTIRVLELDEVNNIITKEERKLSFSILNEQVMKKKSNELISELAENIKSALNDDLSGQKTSGVLIGT
ncbi:MAG: hypothetical protein ABI462_06290, partial [Ignavibacteria bacterium]